MKYVLDKDRKAFAADLKTIYHASNEEQARVALDRVNDKWTPKYPNAIESLYLTYRNLNRQGSVFCFYAD